jgi:hypothetical protein
MTSKFDANLLTDRVEFKLFGAQIHLNNLLEIQLNYSNFEKDNPVVQAELEIDCFLAQILGALDCLLTLINTRLELGVAIGKVDQATIQSALNARTKNISLLTELSQASQHNGWLWVLKEFRDQTMQRPSKEAQAVLFDDRKTSITSKDPKELINKNLILYFQQTVNRVRELVNNVRMKEPLLK